MKTDIKKLPKSEIQIDFELDEKEFAQYWQKALEHLKGHVKVDGFRAGQVPIEMVEKKAGVENVLMEAGDLAVKAAYAKYINENNLEPIAQPEVQITKIAKGSPFLFTVKVAVLPEIALPDYKEIVSKVKANNVAVDEKEIEEALVYLQKSRAKFTDKTEGAAKKDYVKIAYQNEKINGGQEVKDMFILGEGGFLPDFEDNLLGMKVGEEKEFTAQFPENAPREMAGKEGKFKVKMLALQTMELSEINDELAKSLGAFDSLVALKENLKEGITLEKQEGEKQRKRGEILTKISEKIAFDLPEKMVTYEQERMVEDLKSQIEHAGMKFEEYLASAKKTEEDMRKSFAVQAERRIKNYLVLRAIGKAENIEVTKEELEEEMNKEMRKHDKTRSDLPAGQAGKIDLAQLKEYSKGVIMNEKIFQSLEKLSQN